MSTSDKNRKPVYDSLGDSGKIKPQQTPQDKPKAEPKKKSN